MEDEPKQEVAFEELKCIFEQNWLHARHVENERLLFTSLYVALTSAVLVYLGRANIDTLRTTYQILIIFLLGFSILGFIVTLKLSSEFENHMKKIEKMLDETQIKKYKDFIGLPKNVGIWKVIKVRYAFMIFYVIAIALWIKMLFLSF